MVVLNVEVLQCSYGHQTVYPRLQFGILLEHEVVGFGNVATACDKAFGFQSMPQHIVPSAQYYGAEGSQTENRIFYGFLHYLFQISHAAKACSSNISRPFLVTAPCAWPFFMKRVSFGLYNKS